MSNPRSERLNNPPSSTDIQTSGSATIQEAAREGASDGEFAQHRRGPPAKQRADAHQHDRVGDASWVPFGYLGQCQLHNLVKYTVGIYQRDCFATSDASAEDNNTTSSRISCTWIADRAESLTLNHRGPEDMGWWRLSIRAVPPRFDKLAPRCIEVVYVKFAKTGIR